MEVTGAKSNGHNSLSEGKCTFISQFTNDSKCIAFHGHQRYRESAISTRQGSNNSSVLPDLLKSTTYYGPWGCQYRRERHRDGRWIQRECRWRWEFGRSYWQRTRLIEPVEEDGANWLLSAFWPYILYNRKKVHLSLILSLFFHLNETNSNFMVKF